MDWRDLSPLVGAVAPTLGGILGGALPIPFGSAIGSMAGQAIASALGVEATPEAVNQALQASPQDVLREQLAAAEQEAHSKWRALGEMAKADAQLGEVQVAATANVMTAELVNGAWYQKWWRPLAMYVWIGSWPFQLYCILHGLTTRDPATIGSLSSMVYALCAWNAAPAALGGVYAFGRSQEKIAGMRNGNGDH